MRFVLGRREYYLIGYGNYLIGNNLIENNLIGNYLIGNGGVVTYFITGVVADVGGEVPWASREWNYCGLGGRQGGRYG